MFALKEITDPREIAAAQCEMDGHLAIVMEYETGKYCKWCPRCGERVGEGTPGRMV